MKIEYDPDADAMDIIIKEGEFDHNKVINRDLIIDYDKEGNILTIEVLFVKETNPHLLKQLKSKTLLHA